MEVTNLEVEEDLSTMANTLLGGMCVVGKMKESMEKALEADPRSAGMETSEEDVQEHV